MRPLKPPGVHRSLTKGLARTRNLERRFAISDEAFFTAVLELNPEDVGDVGNQTETVLAPNGWTFALTVTWRIVAGNSITLSLYNGDTADHMIQLANASVQEIGSTDRETIQGDPVTAVAGTFTKATFDTKIGGTSLFDLSTPDQPPAAATAVYCVAVTLNLTA